MKHRSPIWNGLEVLLLRQKFKRLSTRRLALNEMASKDPTASHMSQNDGEVVFEDEHDSNAPSAGIMRRDRRLELASLSSV